MSCTSVISLNDVTAKLREQVGTNDSLFLKYETLLKDGDGFSKKFKTKLKEKFNSETLNTIKSSIDYIATLQFPTGNFPSSVDGDKDDKVHFCHGPIGAIHLFALSAEIFNDQMYLVPMEKCAKSIWERGLLLKGNCICHGISGSVYGMYKLYQVTKKEEYLIKAMMLAKGTYDPYVQNKVIVTDDPQRKVVGIPDTPYSLMEGMGGTLVMYYDLIGGNMRFPGYEIY